MQKIKLHLLALFLLLCFISPLTHAGSRPHIIVFMDISTQAPYQDGAKLFAELFYTPDSSLSREGGCFACASARDVDGALGDILPTPANLTPELVRQALAGNKESLHEIQKILYDYHDFVDGLIVYFHNQGRVAIYGIPALVGGTINSSHKEVRHFLKLESLDQMIEDAMHDFPVRNP